MTFNWRSYIDALSANVQRVYSKGGVSGISSPSSASDLPALDEGKKVPTARARREGRDSMQERKRFLPDDLRPHVVESSPRANVVFRFNVLPSSGRGAGTA